MIVEDSCPSIYTCIIFNELTNGENAISTAKTCLQPVRRNISPHCALRRNILWIVSRCRVQGYLSKQKDISRIQNIEPIAFVPNNVSSFSSHHPDGHEIIWHFLKNWTKRLVFHTKVAKDTLSSDDNTFQFIAARIRIFWDVWSSWGRNR